MDTGLGGAKVTKRRAARACTSCRARKVRCDVVEGAPCGNCRWDDVHKLAADEGFVDATASFSHGKTSLSPIQEHRSSQEHALTSPLLFSRKHHFPPRPPMVGPSSILAEAVSARAPNPVNITSADLAGRGGLGIGTHFPAGQAPHLYQQIHGFLPSPIAPPIALPRFIKPLPDKLSAEDARFLAQKGALTLPLRQLEAALLKAFVEYVYPYMPLIDLHEFLNAINCEDGSEGTVSLFLYQSIMFVSAAFVDVKALQDAGFPNKRKARKAFFAKTRLLYDFDYEPDRLVLVQALLFMTYWYETPDDQKDTWHWMGVAISLAHTIGLHRNPARTTLTPQKQSLWKRIWWSCFMRDRLVALGMRRPTRIKDEDFDVPMLVLADFDIKSLPNNNQLLGPDCAVARDMEMQRQLALMCIEKAKLTIIISHMLKVQYSVLSRDGIRPEATTSSTMMLFPNKTLDNLGGVQEVDVELTNWYRDLPICCQRREVTLEEVGEGRSTLAVHRSLLHMIYYTTISALHRPQYLPPSPQHAQTATIQNQDVARARVRNAAEQITRMAGQLHRFQLERFLPTTGVTVLLPACIIHLLDMRGPEPTAARAKEGFQMCMQVMQKLREPYAAADFASGFLEAAHRKSNTGAAPIQQNQQHHHQSQKVRGKVVGSDFNLSPVAPESLPRTPPPENAPYMNATEASLYHQNRTYVAADIDGNQTLVHGQSTPHSDRDQGHESEREGRSASGTMSPYTNEPAMFDGVSMDARPDETAPLWSAMASGENIDFSQWLQFPAEGLNNSDEVFISYGSGGTDNTGSLGNHSVEWMEPQQQQQQYEGSAIGELGAI
ncbi:cutinase transcription factor 1 beta [Podospora appendiculata]|uniref:Cutinase transcription factor 1 beta n=1 Tax=Podospora appendiculata TaxID=314037 RepID=A0AAE0X5U8_9PEZI|nr:cutinase transcription factor 1 beta [Podospora appendiculata]